ncbi:ORF-95 [Teiidae poxvirus 1]|nr:ORF-95 [Teiidae poxvirus 1]
MSRQKYIVTKAPKGNLNTCQKLCYAIGGMPYQLTTTVLNLFIQVFLLDVALLKPVSVSFIHLVGHTWDAVTGPLVGYLISKTEQTPLGRLMPWIVLSTPFGVVAYLGMWVVPNFVNCRFLWYLFFYCGFQTFIACFYVPYSALVMVISKDQNDRSSSTAYRMVMEIFGIIIGIIIQTQFVRNAKQHCVNATYVEYKQIYTESSYTISAGIIGSIYLICTIILYYGLGELPLNNQSVSANSMTFVQCVKLVLRHKPYAISLVSFLLVSMGFMLVKNNVALFCIYVIGLSDYSQIILTLMIAAVASIPLWHLFVIRFGKRTPIFVGVSTVIPFLVLSAIKNNLIVIHVTSIVLGTSAGCVLLLSWSLLPDTIDDFNANNPEHRGNDTVFFSLYVFFIKFASGISLGISTLALELVGYVAKECVQKNEVKVAITMLVSYLPAILFILGLVVFRFYPINEEARKRNKTIIDELQ